MAAFQTMELDKRIWSERTSQINTVFQLTDVEEQAETLVRCKDYFKLDGDFEAALVLKELFQVSFPWNVHSITSKYEMNAT